MCMSWARFINILRLHVANDRMTILERKNPSDVY